MIAQIDTNYIATRPFKLYSRMVSYGLFEGRPLTTRGQWINPLVFALFSLAKIMPQLRRIHQPVFILGTGRSGTTILGIVLSMHRDVGFLNEPKALWHSIYSKEDLIGSYSRGHANYRLDATDANELVKRNAHRLFGAYLAATFSGRVVDKYPELIFRVPFVKEIFPDAKFIFLVRNGWDTCYSIEGWSSRLGQNTQEETHDWWGADRRKWNLMLDQLVPQHDDLSPYAEEMRHWTCQTDMAAVEWIVTMREGLKLLEQYSNDILKVDYEVLCSQPVKELSLIAEFAGLDKKDDIFFSYATQTLKTVKPKSPFDLHPSIREAFRDTMVELGYAD